jgi:hypothetical protein
LAGEIVEPLPEEAVVRLLSEASERIALGEAEQRVCAWEIIGDLCNGRPEHVVRSWSVVRGRLDSEADAEVVESAIDALRRMAANDSDEHMVADARNLLLAHSGSAASAVRLAVAQGLPWCMGDPPDDRVVTGLIRLTHDPVDDIRDWATFGLAEMADVDSTEVRAAFKERLTDEHEDTRAEATVGLALRGDDVVKAPLLTELASDRVGRLAVHSAGLLADDDFLPLLVALRDWWDVDIELLEKSIRRCDPEQRATDHATFQQLRQEIGACFAKTPMRVISVGVTDDVTNHDWVINLQWVDAFGETNEAFFDFDAVMARDDVSGDPVAAARRIVEMLDE